ncbi:PREDICTED: homeobox protein PKNOX2-like isoform X1 [Papilio xuthus]|uniref:Homeobox protein PKNOX2-like isoform X1 n=1 Tax=Papilio xuthus TaxID=66420 RepID=A0AAJ6ZQI3_PAPXU|nr:PREDICTED: homeobox protein PKNOX2-like isoform X1 [Papilio xuthus]
MQGGAPAADADQAQFEADKRAVYKHPLFPLLALLLERCEQATAGAEAPAADAFGADLQAFVQHQRRDRRPFLVDDPEIDGLMIKSIQVLRIHLLELEKVQELCRDFCGRYIACLKTKMQSENLLRTDYTSGGIESNNNLSGTMDDHSSTSNSPQYQVPKSPPAPLAAATYPAVFPPHAALPAHAPHAPADMHYAQTHRDPASMVVQGSTPISQIGAGLVAADTFTGTNSSTSNQSALSQSCSSLSGSPPPDDEEEGGKRGVLPRHATQAMRAWLFQHLVHPYPTEEEKRSLAAQTRLTLLQVNNWFINARRRILQPMLDCNDKPGGKKSKNGSSISKRYWPDALTNPQYTAGLLSSSEDEEQDGEQSGEEQESQHEESSDPAYPIQQSMH